MDEKVEGEVVEQVQQEIVPVSEDTKVVVQPENKVANYFFDDATQVDAQAKPIDQAGALVNEALGAGIVHKVKTDDTVKEKILKTADECVDAHLDVAKSNADKARKEAYFEANRDACTYFGYDGKTTSKSHIKMMKAWAWFFNTLYILTIGFFVVAPISFFFHKIRVVIKHTWVVLLLAILIYVAIVGTPFLVAWLEGLL